MLIYLSALQRKGWQSSIPTKKGKRNSGDVISGGNMGAGKSWITTVLTLSSRVITWREMVVLLIAISMVGAVVLVVLWSANRVGGLVGYRGQRILLRFMGLILAAVGAEVLLGGIYTFVPRR